MVHRRKVRYALDAEPKPVPAPTPLPSLPPGVKILSVLDLTRGVRRLLENSFPEVAVRGEVSGVSRPLSGHVYFSLRDAEAAESAQIACVLFRDAAGRQSGWLEDGARVVVIGRLAVYEPRGQYQIIAHSVVLEGQGLLLLQLQALKARLEAAGLFAQERKRPLPVWPERIGIVTSLTGAALHDILRVVFRRNPGAWVRIFPARVQGAEAPDEIARQLSLCGGLPAPVDVVIVGRGGGSVEDLWAFNDERVVRAVAACRVPVISAVGHEIDFTLSDFAADVRAQTPTHAGELVVPDVATLHERLCDLRERSVAAVLRHLTTAQQRLKALAARPVLRSPREAVYQRQQRLDELTARLQKALYINFLRWQNSLLIISERLKLLNPRAILTRGYAMVLDQEGSVARSASKYRPGDRLTVILGDGTLDAEVLPEHGKEKV